MTADLPTKRTVVRVVAAEPLSPTVRRLRVQAAQSYSWRPGQHVALRRQPDAGPDSYYSFASTEAATALAEFELAIGLGPATIGALQVGDELHASPAQGLDMLAAFPAPRPLVLIAQGTGIAPLRAVIQEAVRRQRPGGITLLHGCRTEGDRLFSDEFCRWEAQGHLEYLPVLSQPSPSWAGLSGRVQAHLDRVASPDRAYLICGSLSMVTSTAAELTERGVPADGLLAEGY